MLQSSIKQLQTFAKAKCIEQIYVTVNSLYAVGYCQIITS